MICEVCLSFVEIGDSIVGDKKKDGRQGLLPITRRRKLVYI